MTTIFASDPHGTGNAWINKVNLMLAKHPEAKLVFGGDYIDGRSSSKQILNYVRQMQIERNATVLKGNHEDLMEQFLLLKGEDRYGWFPNGAKTTIKSLFGRGYSKQMSYQHLMQYKLYDGIYLFSWVATLPTVYVNRDGCFVHAYLDTYWKNIQKAIHETNETERLWRRDLVEMNSCIVNQTGKTIIIGHTPTCYFEYCNNKNIKITKYQSPINQKQQYACPIIESQRTGYQSIIACDGGCHSLEKFNTGNVVVIDKGSIIDWIN